MTPPGRELLYEVAVAAPLDATLTYTQPEGREAEIAPGTPVLVPLGRRRLTGYVLGPAAAPAEAAQQEEKTFQLRPIEELLSARPFFPAEMIPFFRWIATYYHHPIGEVLHTALPLAPKARSGRRIRLTPAGKAALEAGLPEGVKEESHGWVGQLARAGLLEPGESARLFRRKADTAFLRRLARDRLVEIEPLLLRSGAREKTRPLLYADGALLVLTEEAGTAQAPEALVQALERQACSDVSGSGRAGFGKAVRATLLLFLELIRGRRAVGRDELRARAPQAARHLKKLLDLGLLREEKERVYRDPFGDTPPFIPPPQRLTGEQEEVLDQLVPAIGRQVFAPFLLFGVTGSGKTEVYLRAVRHALDAGLSALVLVPEIALASQLEAHFYSRFGASLAVLHSGLAEGERLDQWQRVLDGTARVVLGARSAVFAPLSHLGLVIVDEEHEGAYKQEEGLCYHGRDLAVLRAHRAGCPVLLGSATPSLVSFHHAMSGKYTLLRMEQRVSGQGLPRVEVVDLSKAGRSRPDLTFSDPLIAALRDTLEQRRQSLLFVNRRGFSPFMLCQDCGHILQCRHCQVSLTLHRAQGRLLCHYCGYSRSPAALCPACGSTRVRGAGAGAERIEEEVRQLFPEARVARLDSDSAGQRHHYLRILKMVREGQIDILIGTQMIAKGLHFPNITLVGVVWADSGLGLPDYKAAERTFALLSQVTGRAGRGDQPGRVIIQTHQPDHYAIQSARSHDFSAFYEQEIAIRRSLSYPPFSRLVNIRFTGIQEERVRQTAHKTAALLRQRVTAGQAEVLGPAPAPLARIKDRIRWQLLLKSPFPALLQEMAAHLLADKKALCPHDVRMSFDVDPENMM